MTSPNREEAANLTAPVNVVIEQYKAKIADLGNLGVRHTAASASYVSIVSALLAVLALKEKALANVDAAIFEMVCGAGFGITILWWFALSFFRSLFRAKLKVLEQIEEVLPFQTFRTEFQLMRDSGSASWLWIERLVPILFGTCFVGLGLWRLFPPVT